MTGDIKWLGLIVIVLMVAVGGVGLWHKHFSDKAYSDYKAKEEESRKAIDGLQGKLIELQTKADQAEARAAEKEKERDAAYKQLEVFGAQGRIASERLKKAGEQFATDSDRIHASTDNCQLCQDTCAERERISTNDFDVRCSGDACAKYCH